MATRPALLFVSLDLLAQSFSALRTEIDMRDPPENDIYLERRAFDPVGIGLGDDLAIDIPGAGFVAVPVAASVFDPSLAPADKSRRFTPNRYASRPRIWTQVAAS